MGDTSPDPTGAAVSLSDRERRREGGSWEVAEQTWHPALADSEPGTKLQDPRTRKWLKNGPQTWPEVVSN